MTNYRAKVRNGLLNKIVCFRQAPNQGHEMQIGIRDYTGTSGISAVPVVSAWFGWFRSTIIVELPKHYGNDDFVWLEVCRYGHGRNKIDIRFKRELNQ